MNLDFLVYGSILGYIVFPTVVVAQVVNFFWQRRKRK